MSTSKQVAPPVTSSEPIVAGLVKSFLNHSALSFTKYKSVGKVKLPLKLLSCVFRLCHALD